MVQNMYRIEEVLLFCTYSVMFSYRMCTEYSTE
jgi:hypothetical protein